MEEQRNKNGSIINARVKSYTVEGKNVIEIVEDLHGVLIARAEYKGEKLYSFKMIDTCDVKINKKKLIAFTLGGLLLGLIIGLIC